MSNFVCICVCFCVLMYVGETYGLCVQHVFVNIDVTVLHTCAHVHAWLCVQVCRRYIVCMCVVGRGMQHMCIFHVCVVCMYMCYVSLLFVCVQVSGQCPRDRHLSPSPAPVLCPGTCPVRAAVGVLGAVDH